MNAQALLAGARRLGRWPHWEALALATLAVAAFAGFVLYPTYPNYDSLYSLLWAKELLHGQLPSLEAYRAPTQHPLWVAICLPLAALGTDGDRVLLGLCVATYVALVAGLYRLGRDAFGWAVGLVAAVLLLSRLDFSFYAARAYIDIPYLALIVWAGTLEVQRPKRGGLVWVLLVLAGLLRPEAWLLAGIYGIWMAWGKSPRAWVRVAAIAAIAPVIWALTDVIVTGDPLFSLNYTTESAALLGRRQTVAEMPRVTVLFLSRLTKPPVFVAALAGIVLTLRLARGRLLVPATLLVWGTGVFVLVSLRGFSVISRYLLTAALMLLLFAAFAMAGFSLLQRGHRARRPWAAGSLLIVLVGVAYTIRTVDLSKVDRELVLRDDVRHDLTRLLSAAPVRAARACGPISVPNHKLIADVRWIVGADVRRVVARSDPKDVARSRRGGVAIFVVGGTRFLKHPAYGPFDQTEDSPSIQVPTQGFARAEVGRYFSAYVRCRAGRSAFSAAPARASPPAARG